MQPRRVTELLHGRRYRGECIRIGHVRQGGLLMAVIVRQAHGSFLHGFQSLQNDLLYCLIHHAGEGVDESDRDVGEVLHELDREIFAEVHELPLAHIIGKRLDRLDLEVGE